MRSRLLRFAAQSLAGMTQKRACCAKLGRDYVGQMRLISVCRTGDDEGGCLIRTQRKRVRIRCHSRQDP
jgi:hypothetical protein